MEVSVSLLGAIVALVIAIGLILKKVPPAYGMMVGALVGSLVGGLSLTDTIAVMFDGAKGIIPAVLRILSAGVLAGVLIESGGARTIAETLVSKLGEKKALFALAFSTMILTMAGVFIDIAVITVAPIALAIASKAKISKLAILVAMIGGGKAGNIMSANPNAIAASEAFDVPLTSLMATGIVPAIFGVIVTYFLAKRLINKGEIPHINDDVEDDSAHHPNFFAAILGPIVAVCILALRPAFDINVDPMLALPLGGVIGCLAMGKIKNLNEYSTKGLARMTGVAIMLLGTGTLAGVIKVSALGPELSSFLENSGLPAFVLAPVSGMFMSFATASTTAGTTVASQVFGPTLLSVGVPALASAAMIQAGATVLDHMPHGSFFHSTGGSVGIGIKERLRALPYESLIGLTLTIVMTVGYIIIDKFF